MIAKFAENKIKSEEIKKILTIAGSDSSGGAGIQADLKTIHAHHMYGMSVITSITAQNTTGVYGIDDVSPEFVEKQIDAVFGDIRPDAVKIGMVSNVEIIKMIVKKLKEYKPDIIVADTVMVSTSGCMLIEEEAKRVLSKELFPIADIITPNVPEAEVLSGIEIRTENDMEKAAEILSKNNKAVLIKGGHMAGEANDLLRVNHQNYWYKAMRVNNDNTHGTGCTLSSAIACEMADGKDICDAVKAAKRYVYHAISAGLNLGNGSGPLWHDVD